MPNEWKVILRAANSLDLTEIEREQYIHQVTEIYSDKVVDAPPLSKSNRYNDFLNEKIFSDPRLVKFLKETGAPQEVVNRFSEGGINVEKLVQTWNQIQFTLDELIDLIMILKLVRDYSEVSHNGRIDSRYRLQKLLYLVNAQLREENNPGQRGQFENELGMLDRTGYRYQFVRRESGPYAEVAYEDKNRLFAWNLVDEPVVGEEGTGEVAERNRRYGIELSAEGEIFTERFYDKIKNSDSIMVQEWNLAQKVIIEQTAAMSQNDLQNHVGEITDSNVGTGEVYLSGPTRKFKKNDVEFLDQLADRMESMMQAPGEIQVVGAHV